MPDRGDIAPLIREETTRVETLLRVLDEELRALGSRDTQRLDSLATHKHQLVRELEALGIQRRILLGPQGCATNWADSPEGQPLRPAWKRLAQLVDKAKHNNRRNGTAIAAATRYTRRAVDVLFCRRESDTVYGALGERKRLTTNRYSSSA